jgi:hypothetical protein
VSTITFELSKTVHLISSQKGFPGLPQKLAFQDESFRAQEHDSLLKTVSFDLFYDLCVFKGYFNYWWMGVLPTSIMQSTNEISVRPDHIWSLFDPLAFLFFLWRISDIMRSND